MKILSAEFYQFKPFRFSGITRLNFEILSDTLLILGDNGCGKSSLLRELNPSPACKSDYGKHGRKQITLTHAQKQYVLTSDFGNKVRTHSFLQEGIELNESGTSTVQEELVRRHLNYTPLVHEITHLEHRMSEMRGADRKSLLLAINPVDLTFVLEKHKKVCSLIREHKANLKLLQERKADIETRLLDQDLLNVKYKDREQFQQQINLLTSYIFAVQQYMATVQQEHRTLLDQPPAEIDLARIKRFCHRINQFLISHPELDRRHPDQALQLVSLEEQRCRTSIEQLGAQAIELVREIATYQEHLEVATAEGSTVDLEKQLAEHQAVADSLQVPTGIPLLGEADRQLLLQILTQIQEPIHQFVDKNCRYLWSRSTLQKVQSRTQAYRQETDYRGRRLGEWQLRLDKVEDELRRLHLPATPFEECAPCFYRTTYSERSDLLQTQREECRRELHRGQQQLARRDSALARLGALLSAQQHYHDLVRHVTEQLSRVTPLLASYPYPTVQDKLDKSPFQLIKELQTIADGSLLWQTRERELSKVQELKQHLSVLSASNIPSMDFLRVILEEKRIRHSRLTTEIDQFTQQQTTAQQTTETYRRCVAMQHKLQSLQQEIVVYEEWLQVTSALDYCGRLIAACDRVRSHLSEKLREIETTLKEQESLLSRYNDEILVLLEQCTLRKKQYEELERALSPATGFTHSYMVRYINRLIDNVNRAISQVWSYDMQLQRLDLDKPLDFIFPIKVGEELVPDISRCSDGQKAMINMAWTISFILHRKLTDYPIYLDECDRELDPTHKQRLLEWLKMIGEMRYVSQMYLINHSAVLFRGFVDSDVLALREENIVVPDNKNKHAQIT